MMNWQRMLAICEAIEARHGLVICPQVIPVLSGEHAPSCWKLVTRESQYEHWLVVPELEIEHLGRLAADVLAGRLKRAHEQRTTLVLPTDTPPIGPPPTDTPPRIRRDRFA